MTEEREKSPGYQKGCPWPVFAEGIVGRAARKDLSIEAAAGEIIKEAIQSSGEENIQPVLDTLEWLQFQSEKN
ncbi:hypothetical protein ACFL0Y_02535 [Patescibacteria group bacterium]